MNSSGSGSDEDPLGLLGLTSAAAGVAPDSPYRRPLVDLAGGRDRALAAFKALSAG